MFTIDANGMTLWMPNLTLSMRNEFAKIRKPITDARNALLDQPTIDNNQIIWATKSICALLIAEQNMHRLSQTLPDVERIKGSFEATLSTLKKPEPFDQLTETQHQELFTLLRETYTQSVSKESPRTPFEAIYLIFNLHKQVISELCLRWGFDVANVVFH